MNEQASMTEPCLDLPGNLCSQPSTKSDTDEETLSLHQSMESKEAQRRGTGPGSISKEGAHHRRTATWSVYDPTQQWRRREQDII